MLRQTLLLHRDIIWDKYYKGITSYTTQNNASQIDRKKGSFHVLNALFENFDSTCIKMRDEDPSNNLLVNTVVFNKLKGTPSLGNAIFLNNAGKVVQYRVCTYNSGSLSFGNTHSFIANLEKDKTTKNYMLESSISYSKCSVNVVDQRYGDNIIKGVNISFITGDNQVAIGIESCTIKLTTIYNNTANKARVVNTGDHSAKIETCNFISNNDKAKDPLRGIIYCSNGTITIINSVFAHNTCKYLMGRYESKITMKDCAYYNNTMTSVLLNSYSVTFTKNKATKKVLNLPHLSNDYCVGEEYNLIEFNCNPSCNHNDYRKKLPKLPLLFYIN